MRRKSVILKILEGNPGKRKLPTNEPIPPAEFFDPPATLDAYALEEWERVTPGLYALGILAGLDRALLAAYCSSYSRWRSAEEELQKQREKGGNLNALVDWTKAGNIIQNPLIGISNAAAAAFVRYGDLLGMGESARARLGIDRAKGKPSKFNGLIGMMDNRRKR